MNQAEARTHSINDETAYPPRPPPRRASSGTPRSPRAYAPSIVSGGRGGEREAAGTDNGVRD